MLIKVLFSDGSPGVVDDSKLSQLIDRGDIVQFLRADGWVHIRCGPIRRTCSDRRQPGKMLNTYI